MQAKNTVFWSKCLWFNLSTGYCESSYLSYDSPLVDISVDVITPSIDVMYIYIMQIDAWKTIMFSLLTAAPQASIEFNLFSDDWDVFCYTERSFPTDWQQQGALFGLAVTSSMACVSCVIPSFPWASLLLTGMYFPWSLNSLSLPPT